MILRLTRYWVLKNSDGQYYTARGPIYWVLRQKDAWRYSERDAQLGAQIGRGVRAVRVFKYTRVKNPRPAQRQRPDQ